MNRRRAILYSRITLSTPELVESTLRWAQRKYRVERIVTEHSEAQPELRRLLETKSVVVIAPDAFHLAAPEKIPRILASAVATVILAAERLTLNRRRAAAVFKFAQAVSVAYSQTRRHHSRLALLCTKLIGKQVGRPAIPESIRDRAVALLNSGKSLRDVARETGISKTTVQRLAKRLKRVPLS